MLSLSNLISDICRNAEVPVVFMIDEVDQASNHKVFIDFLGMLRSKFLKRSTRPTFQSVILAGVYDIKNMLYAILFQGESYPYNPDNFVMDIGTMFGFIKEKDGQAVISNRIFETRLYNLFLSEELTNSAIYQSGERDKNQFIQDGILNMELVLEKFMTHFHDIYGENTEQFVEENVL